MVAVDAAKAILRYADRPQRGHRNPQGSGSGWALDSSVGGSESVGVAYYEAPRGGISISASTLAQRTA